MNDDEEVPDIHLVMARQHGAAATNQVRQSLRWRQQRSLVDTRIWQQDDQRVVTSRASARTWHQQVMIAALSTRGVASHATAARLHRFDGFNRCNDVHVTLRYQQRRHLHPGAFVHISRVFNGSDRLLVDGIPTVIIPVCLIQIAEQPSSAMIKALEGAMRDGVSPTWIRQVASRYERPGLTGARRLVRALDERVDGVLPRSWFQRMAAHLLDDLGIPTTEEHPIYQGSRLLAELDLAIPDLRIGLECQSWRWHATPHAQQRDAARKRRLRRLGWEIIDLWWSDLDRFDDVVDTLQVVIAERRADVL